jgi:TonB family protein
MMRYGQNLSVGAIVLVWALWNPTNSHAEEDQKAFTCLEQLTIPKYPLIARQARREGIVELLVRIGDTGRTENSTRSDANILLQEAVMDAANRAKFSGRCAGYEIRMAFIFELNLQADPRTADDGTITLESPNKITIRAAPFPLSGSGSQRKNRSLGGSPSRALSGTVDSVLAENERKLPSDF